MFQVTFLGTSGGTPTIDRGMPAIAIKYESELFLWDCGEGTQRQMMKWRVGYGSIDAVFISHPHVDHFLGLFGLLETLKIQPSPKKIRLFLPRRVELFAEYPFAPIERIATGELYRKEDFSIQAFKVKHCRDSFGFIFEEHEKIKFHEEKAHKLGLKGKLFREIQAKGSVKTASGNIVNLEDVTWKQPGRKIVYSGDALPSEDIVEAARGADLLIHEATFESEKKDEAKERLHSTAEDAAKAAKSAGVKHLILTHISPRYSDAVGHLVQARKIFQNTDLAYDGFVVSL